MCVGCVGMLEYCSKCYPACVEKAIDTRVLFPTENFDHHCPWVSTV